MQNGPDPFSHVCVCACVHMYSAYTFCCHHISTNNHIIHNLYTLFNLTLHQQGLAACVRMYSALPTAVHTHRVGQNRIYAVCTIFLAGNLPNLRSCTVHIHGSGQPCLVCMIYDTHSGPRVQIVQYVSCIHTLGLGCTLCRTFHAYTLWA